jgi:hypothetical protein
MNHTIRRRASHAALAAGLVALATCATACGGGKAARCTRDSDCGDGVGCTDDVCTASGLCVHRPNASLCAADKWCNPWKGCEPASICGTDDDCQSSDPCVTSYGCDPATRMCVFGPLDGDGDGESPLVCGGSDCDDSDFTVLAQGSEICNGADDDCDGIVDNQPAADEDCDRLVPTMTCRSGSCVCPTGRTHCGGRCVDLATEPVNCGACGHVCVVPATCAAGACECPGGATYCEAQGACVDTTSDANNCGGCGQPCGGSVCYMATWACVNSACTCVPH